MPYCVRFSHSPNPHSVKLPLFPLEFVVGYQQKCPYLAFLPGSSLHARALTEPGSPLGHRCPTAFSSRGHFSSRSPRTAGPAAGTSVFLAPDWYVQTLLSPLILKPLSFGAHV